jgi:D-xylose reductase
VNLEADTSLSSFVYYNQGLWKVPENACAESVYQAIKAGYRMFDSSSDYANEHESGKGLKRAIDEGLVKREDVFIVTKLWNTFKVSYAARPRGMQGGIGEAHAFGQWLQKAENVEPECRRQLANWQTDYFDLYVQVEPLNYYMIGLTLAVCHQLPHPLPYRSAIW